MSEHRFTKRQRELMVACAKDFDDMGSGVLVKGLWAEYSQVTASSLERKGWLCIRKNSIGELWAYLNGEQNAEWVELNGGLDAE